MTAPGPGGFRRLAVLIAVNFVDMVGFMIVLPLLPFYALELKASPEIVGALIASFSIAQLVAAPFWGRVSDRYGRRPALLIGLTASAIAYGVFAFAENGHGELFAVGRGGLQRLTGEAPRRFTKADGLKDDFVASIVRLPDDSFVIGYREALGVARLRVHADRLELVPIARGAGQASDMVQFVGRDSAEQLWVGGDRGLEVFAADGSRSAYLFLGRP